MVAQPRTAVVAAINSAAPAVPDPAAVVLDPAVAAVDPVALGPVVPVADPVVALGPVAHAEAAHPRSFWFLKNSLLKLKKCTGQPCLCPTPISMK